jgi:hypothetical protein
MRVSIALFLVVLSFSLLASSVTAQTSYSDFFGFSSTTAGDDDDDNTTIPIQQITGSSIGSSERSFTQEVEYGAIHGEFNDQSTLSFTNGASDQLRVPGFLCVLIALMVIVVMV